MTSLRQDFSSAIRFFRRRKSAFAVIVVTVALALAANTTAFTVVRGFFLASLGVPKPEEVVVVPAVRNLPGQGPTDFSDAYPNYRLLRETTHSFSAMGASISVELNWQEKDETRHVQGEQVTASFFTVMKVQPLAGRFFAEREEGPHAAPVAVISYKFWRSAFAGLPGTVGTVMHLNGVPHTIVGVMQQGFSQPNDADVWLPFDLPDTMWTKIIAARQVSTFARLAPGVSLSSANQELKGFAETAIRFDPANKDWSWRAQSLRDNLLNGSGGVVIFIQIGAAVLLLLAVCNLISILLAWGAEREHETAVRRALGATTTRLVRQFVVQSLLVVSVAGGVAMGLVCFALPILKGLNPNRSLALLLQQVQIENLTIAFAAVVVVAAAVVAGLLPAWQTRSVSLESTLRSQSRGGGASARAIWWQQAMIVLQAAIAVLILTSAVIAGVALFKLARIQLGFETKQRVVFRIQLPEPAIDTHQKRVQFVRALEQNLEREPALTGYGLTTTLPVGDLPWGGSFLLQLASGAYAEDPALFQLRRVSASYLQEMRIPLLQGRLFTSRDRMDAPPVAIVSKTLAAKYWPGSTPIGRKVYRASAPDIEYQIVGVVDDVRDNGPTVPIPETLYLPFEQFSNRHLSIVLRSRNSTVDAIAAGKRALHNTDPGVAAFDIASLDDLASQTLALPRLEFALFAGFAIVAISITGLGAYGVMRQVIAVREKELAIRSALGASRANVVGLLVLQNARLASLGSVAGLTAAWLIVRLARSAIAGLESIPTLWVSVFVGVVVLGIIQIAGVVPLRRAVSPGLYRLLGSS